MIGNETTAEYIRRLEADLARAREALEALGEWLLKSIAEDEANDPNL